MKLFLFLIFIPLTVWPLTVGAGEKKSEPAQSQAPSKTTTQEAAPPKIIFKKTERHQFQGSRLKGQLKKPELSYIYQRKGLRAEKIVNVPEKFDDEILRGAGQF